MYKINGWNEIIDSSNTLRPIFTFIPDLKFLNYISTNSNPLFITINGTNGIYDGKQYAYCISSSDFPNFGPNYYDVTKNYVIVLQTDFTFFPNQNQLGQFEILDNVRFQQQTPSSTNEEDFEDIPLTSPSPPSSLSPPLSPSSHDDDESHNNHVSVIFWVFISILIILLVMSTVLYFKTFF
jgi:hypothetical protein